MAQSKAESPAVQIMEENQAEDPVSQPFNSLQELYENLSNLKPWPNTVPLRESAEYVYKGSDVSSQRLKLDKVDRDEQPRTLVCHDMKGGYLEDRFINGSKSHDSYLFYHWSIIDTFVYFSHHFVTIPPYGWVNAAHNHGVKVLGTVITEGTGIWEVILESVESAKKFADALITLAEFYNFDGWLLNVENVIRTEDVEKLIFCIKYLTDQIHSKIDGSEIIWYDSVIKDGKLKWQDQLNDLNKDFFLNCDGIYLNYNWTEGKLANSCILAKEYKRDIRDIYVGLDVWGRGCPGGGGFNSAYAMNKIRQQGLSAAIFAPGWTHEFFGPKTFHVLENIFWAQLYPYLYIHVPIYDNEEFKTSFCRGSGSSYYHYGEVQLEIQKAEKNSFMETPFFNLAKQHPQISVSASHLRFTSFTIPSKLRREDEDKSKDDKESPKKLQESVFETQNSIIRVRGNVVNFEDKLPTTNENCFDYCSQFSYEGGGCLKLITKNPKLYHRLFLVHIECHQDIQATIIYEHTESVENAARNEPILILGNDTGLKSIFRSKSERVNPRWKKWCAYKRNFYLKSPNHVYYSNMKTVNEIGLAFTAESVCYVGEIVLEERRQQLDRWDSTDYVNRISDYGVY